MRAIYGPAPPAVWRDAGTSFVAWARRNRVGWVGAAGFLAFAVVALARNASLAGAAARGTYLLLAVYALHILVNETAQPSLGHAAFMALGAYGTAALRLRLGLDGLLAAVLVTVLGGGAGWLLGWGAARLRPAMLALLTWAFGWMVYAGLGAFPELTGGVAGISFRAPVEARWELLGIDLRFDDTGHVALGLVLLGMLLLFYRLAQTSVIGRGWSALRDSRTLAVSLGYDVASMRRWTFAIAAGVAALAGSLGAQLLQVVDPSLYSPLQSVSLFAAVLIGGPLGFFGPALGALLTEGAPFLVDQASQLLHAPIGSGRQLAAVGLTIIALVASATLRDRRDRQAGTAARSPHRAPPTAPASPAASSAPIVLSAAGVSVRFAGLQALDGVDIELARGMIHGLIGPNGSGKSTLLRCLSGTLAPDRGTVRLGDAEVQKMPEHSRVHAGIARTFQRTAIMPHLLVRDHVEVGLRRTYSDAGWLQAMLRTPAYRADLHKGRRRRAEILRTFGLEAWAAGYPSDLPAGRQRLLQVATAVAAAPTVLLLDEPSAGLDVEETALLHDALTRLSAGGMTILLIEHNMRFLAGLAGRVTVLDGGVVVAAGTPAEVVADEAVRRAYLGAGAQ